MLSRREDPAVTPVRCRGLHHVMVRGRGDIVNFLCVQLNLTIFIFFVIYNLPEQMVGLISPIYSPLLALHLANYCLAVHEVLHI
jgi:hypothetical protein